MILSSSIRLANLHRPRGGTPQAGRRDAALRQYQACVTVLERELRTQPEEATKALYREILQSRSAVASPPEGSADPANPTTAAASLAPSSGVGLPPLPAEAPLIGRHRELSQLTALLDDAWAGGRRLAAIVGEAGVGKSRLAAALGMLAGQRGGRVLLGRCYESERSLPFSPWIDALRGARLAANSEVIEALSPVWRAELGRLLPELQGRLVPPADPPDVLRLFEAVAQCLDALAARAPLLIVLEDLQWSDELSFRLGGFLGRRVRAGPMLILGTMREEQVDAGGLQRRMGDALAHEDLLVRLPLPRLTKEETVLLTRELAGARPAPALAALEREIWRVSEGNPFMVVETVRGVREDRGAAGTWQGAGPRPRARSRRRDACAPSPTVDGTWSTWPRSSGGGSSSPCCSAPPA